MDPCLNFSLRKANRVLNKIYDRHMQACGLKSGQFSILKVIELRKQTTNRELQNIMMVDQTTLSRGLKPLIRDGYITVSPAEDARVKLLSLSAEGRKLHAQGNLLWEQAQESVKKQLGKDFSQKLLEVTSVVAGLKT